MGLLTAERGSDLLDKASWTKSPVPVLKTCAENGQYGPGHNSFTKSEDGTEDLIIYHCRNAESRAIRCSTESPRARRCGQVDRRRSGFSACRNLIICWTPTTTDVFAR